MGAAPEGITTLRKLPFAVLLAVPAASACTSLLGDFSTGGAVIAGPDATTGGLDGATSDGAGAQDATTVSDAGDGGTSSMEAGSDAGGAPKLLACVETMGMRVNLTAQVTGGGEELPYQNLAIASLPGASGTVRIVAQVNNNALHAFTFSQGSNSVTDAVFTLGSGNTSILDIERYPGGFAVLVENASSTNSYLAIERISDMATAWSPEYPVTDVAPASPAPSTQISGALGVVNSATNEFYVAVYDTEGSGANEVDYLRWQHVLGTSTPGPLHVVTPTSYTPTLDAGSYRLAVPGFAFDMSNSYVLLQPAGSGTGGTTSIIYTVSAMGIGQGLPVPMPQTLTPPMGDTLHALAMTNSVLTAGSANLAFLEGDLSTAVLSYYVGQSAVSGLGSLAWQNLTESSPGVDDAGYTIEDLPVNNAAYHWESFPSPAVPPSENFLAVATIGSSQSGTDQGVNLVWFDAVSGTIRASKTGVRRILGDVNGLGYVNATFAGAPSTLLTNMLLAYEVQTSDAGSDNGPEDIWLTQVNCTAAP